MRRRYFVLALLACCLPAAALAGGIRYKFISFDPPVPNKDSIADGINNAGTIVGELR